MDLDQVIAERTRQGWEIVSRTPEGVQLRKRKRVNPLGALLFILLPFLAGFVYSGAWTLMLVGIVIVGLDYLLAKEKLEYIPAARQSADQ